MFLIRYEFDVLYFMENMKLLLLLFHATRIVDARRSSPNGDIEHAIPTEI